MLLYEVRHAFRQLLRERGFTATAVLTLALGIGASVAVFAVVEATLLRPLPYAGADELVVLEHRDGRTGITKPFIAIGDFVDLAARQTSFSRLAAYGSGQVTIGGPEGPYRGNALAAGPGLLEASRVRVDRLDPSGQVGQPEAPLQPCREIVPSPTEPEPGLDEVEVERALVDLEQDVPELLERAHLDPGRDLDDP